MALSQDRLIRKEVALGLIRDFELPQDHIGLKLFAPFQDVASDDVIFEYTQGLSVGLAPARAEDAESELASKDDTVGEGRAAVIDWAIKDHYSSGDINRFRDAVYLDGQIGANLPLSIRSVRDDFNRRYARDARIRRRKLDNRLELLIMSALEDGTVTYDDGRVSFTYDFGRPAAQSNGNGADGASVTPWDDTDADPIGDILAVKEYMRDTYGAITNRLMVSQKIINKILTSSRFTNDLIGSNPLYTVRGWGIDAAKAVVSQACDVEMIVYDSVYYTKPIGSNTKTANRYFDENKILFLPSTASIDAIDDTIGFGKTLTSPHPEGNWTPGYYEWEHDTGPDPWGHDAGTGIKAFPVFPHLDLTYVLDVL